jgi:phage terminase small subunit
MANTSAAGNSFRAARRSTRRDQAILITVSGVDSRRGPYSEKVSTLTISCHGCKYPSKYQVLPEALVTLELTPEKDDAPKMSARGRVKWVQRNGESGGPFYTAVEFEDPYNIWKIDSPPEDWLPFCGERKRTVEPLQAKPFAVPRPELTAKIPEPRSAALVSSGEAVLAQEMPSRNRAVGQLMGGFQQQMEIMISELAAAAVRENTASILNEIRSSLRDDAKAIFSDVAASQTTHWVEQSLKQTQRASQENIRALHSQWTKKIAADLGQSLQQVEARQREVEALSETLFANALERLQRNLEAFQKDAVERIVVRLKDRMAPAFRDAQTLATDLTKRKDELEESLADASEKSSARLAETCERLEKQFEIVMRARLDAAHEELERVAVGVTDSAVENMRAASDRYDTETQARLREGSDRILDSAQKSLDQKAAGTSNDFANELTHYSRSHLEFVSGAIAELAKRIAKLSKD